MAILNVFHNGDLEDYLMRYIGNKTSVKFVGSCLKQDKIKFSHEAIAYLFMHVLILLHIYERTGSKTIII